MTAIHMAMIGSVKFGQVYVQLMANMGLSIVNFQIPEVEDKCMCKGLLT